MRLLALLIIGRKRWDGKENDSTQKGVRDKSEMTDKKEKGDSEESQIEKERVDELVNEWCRLYREIFQKRKTGSKNQR